VNTHCFYISAFLTLCFVLSAIDGKIEQRVCIKFCVKFSKSTTDTLEVLHEAFGKKSLSRTAIFNDIHVSRLVECQLKMMNVQEDHAPENDRKC
jgi:hypothetical protein